MPINTIYSVCLLYVQDQKIGFTTVIIQSLLKVVLEARKRLRWPNSVYILTSFKRSNSLTNQTYIVKES